MDLSAFLNSFISRYQPHCKRIERTEILGGVITPHKRVSLCIHRFDVHASTARSRNSTDSLVRLQVHALLLHRVPRDPLSPLCCALEESAGVPRGLVILRRLERKKKRRRTYFENVVTQRTRTEPRRRRRSVQGSGSVKGLRENKQVCFMSYP